MNKIMIAAIALLSSACVVHAHPPPAPKPAAAPVVHPHGHAHTPAPNAHNVNVRAWVWVSGHRTRHGGWIHGYWDLRTVPRHMLARQPHTHVRYVRGRGKPHPPARRYR